MQWRDEIAEKHPRKADLFISILQRILASVYDREMITRHPLEKVNDGTRRDLIWSNAEINAMRFGVKNDDGELIRKPAPEPIIRALMLALWTEQRQGDLLQLTWTAYDGEQYHCVRGKLARTFE